MSDNCCQTFVQIPGPIGPKGTNGTNGVDGTNAFMILTENYTMPAEGASSDAITTTNEAFVVGQVIFLPGLGYLSIVAKPDVNTTTLFNLEDSGTGEYSDNAAAGTIAGNGSLISPAGLQGPAGVISGSAGGDLKGTYPNPLLSKANTKGASIWGDGANAQNLAASANGLRLKYDSTQSLGVLAAKVDLASSNEVTGLLPTANIANDAVTYAKIQNVTDNRLLGRAGGGAGDPVELTIAGALTLAAGVLTGTAVASTYPVAYIRESKGSGTAAGGALAGANIRQLDAFPPLIDTGGIVVSCAAGTFVLAAGTYRVFARSPAYQVDFHKLFLLNITAATTLAVGSNSLAGAIATETDSWLHGRFTVAAGQSLRLSHSVQTAKVTDGQGQACSLGTEVYAEIWLEKEA